MPKAKDWFLGPSIINIVKKVLEEILKCLVITTCSGKV